jgi:hypothetical protein
MTGGMWASAWGTLGLDRESLARTPAQRRLARGLALLLGISLLVGLVDSAVWAAARLDSWGLRERRAQAVQAVSDELSRSPLPPDVQIELTRNLAAWLDLQGETEGLPRPLGRGAGYALSGLERVLAAPYRRLALWLPYTLVVFALARALGGRGSLAQMLGATSLYAVPHLLDVLRPIPWLGPAAGLAAFGWGAVIYVKATAAANDLGLVQAILVTTLPAMALLTVALLALSAAALLW